ncbi:M56 family metallopeptidase [Chryseobacterium takakiae]|uniref:BlaR1 peptidase M56 n=1 Tax=Chryseobacterium takakiae TaxID=1302685 RepID=A0A1M5A6Y4_9FLAO|nr:M56 family metallopeptidase [Chryseobacterium takakiae]SHF26068.1 BlaR1 peptidase M56 [Chryseobacterium takakiae]
METVLLYFGKVILCSGVIFLYYKLSLKDKTFHHYNRFYLLSAMLISLLLPLVKVEDFTIEVSNDIYKLIDTVQNFNTKNTTHDYTYFRVIFSALGLVSFYFLGRFIYGIFRIHRLKNQFHKESFDGINFYHTNLSEAPFSYFKNLFWKNSIMLNSDVGKQILKHEMVHIEQKHSFDKIFMEIITSVFWFNPFFHLIKKEISLIHEYLADKKAVKQSDTKAFAQMLLASHFSGNQLPATSPFLSSNLKKRLKMLQKPKTKFGYARRIFALPVVFSVAFTYLVNAKNQEIKATNIEIEKAVSQIKEENKIIVKDTISPKSSETKAIVTPKVYRKAEDDRKIAELSKKIQERTEALKNFKPETAEYNKNLEEIGKLSGEIGKIASSKDFLNSAMVIKIDGKDMKFDEYFNSKEFKDVLKEVKDLKYEFEFDMPEIPEMNIEFPDVPAPPDAPKVKVYKFKGTGDIKWSPEADMVLRSSGKTKESAATAKKRAKLDKERARLEEKRAKLEGERAKLEAERRALEGGRRPFIYSNTFRSVPDKHTFRLNADNIKISNNGTSIIASGFKNAEGIENMKIYIDGKESTKGQMEALKPESIKSVNINKKNTDGKTTGEIKIETKK